METITTKDAIRFIQNTNGKIFACKFRKRTDGTLRKMVCRINVKKYLKGGPPPYDFKAHNLIPVFEMSPSEGKLQYRCVPVDNLEELEIRGVWVKVIPVQHELFVPEGPY